MEIDRGPPRLSLGRLIAGTRPIRGATSAWHVTLTLFDNHTTGYEVRFETFSAPLKPRREGNYRIRILPLESRSDRSGVAIELIVRHPDEIAYIRTGESNGGDGPETSLLDEQPLTLKNCDTATAILGSVLSEVLECGVLIQDGNSRQR